MIEVRYECNRVGCEAVESATLSGELDTAADNMPEGWAWDYAGLDEVLHCPEHTDKGRQA